VGLGCVTTAVKKAGFDFDLIDMNINNLSMQDLEGSLSRKTYDVYAFGCIVTGFKFAKEIAKIIKRINPESVIIAGNSVATSIPEIILRETSVDVAVIGEGDETIVELLKKLESKKDIADVEGIAYKRDGNVEYTAKRAVIKEIDDLGFPNWDIFEIDKYKSYGRVNVNSTSLDDVMPFPVNTARGCPYSCTFCYHVFKGERYRRCSDEAAVREIKRLHEMYDCNYILYWNELTFINRREARSMAEKLATLGFQVEWEAAIRGNLFKNEDLALIRDLKAVGCQTLGFSLENASPEILNAINKKLEVSEFIKQAKVLRKGGITPLTSVIFGYPQETPETIKHTLKVCEECGMYPSVGFLLPLPGTPIYEWAKNSGLIPDEVKYLERVGDRQDFHINLTKMPDQEFRAIVQSGLRSLAKKQGLELESVFKTGAYQKPKEPMGEHI